MFNTAYWRDEELNLMYVRVFALNQTIVLQQGYFYKVSGIDRKVVFGCKEINGNILVELGFVFPAKLERKIG